MTVHRSQQISIDWIDRTSCDPKHAFFQPDLYEPHGHCGSFRLTPVVNVPQSLEVENAAFEIFHPGIPRPLPSAFAEWFDISFYNNTACIGGLFLNTEELANAFDLYSIEQLCSVNDDSVMGESWEITPTTQDEFEHFQNNPKDAYDVIALVRTFKVLMRFHGVSLPVDHNKFTIRDFRILIDESMFDRYLQRLSAYFSGTRRTAMPFTAEQEALAIVARVEHHCKEVLMQHPDFAKKAEAQVRGEMARLAQLEPLSWAPQVHMPDVLDKEHILVMLRDLNTTEALIQFLRGERTVHPQKVEAKIIEDRETALHDLSVLKQFTLDYACTLRLGAGLHEQLLSDIETRQRDRTESLEDLLTKVAGLRAYFVKHL